MKDKDFVGLMESVEQALGIAQGKSKPARVHRVRVPKKISVRKIRHGLGMTQHQFATGRS